jgi:hypothetical protein
VHLINALFIAFLVAVLSLSYWYEEKLFDQKSAIGKFSDMLQFAGPFVAHLASLLETKVKRKQHRKLFKSLVTMDKLCKELDIDLRLADAELIRNYTLKFIILNLVAFLTELRIIFGINPIKVWFTNWCFKLTPFIFGRLSDSQLIFFVDFIRNRNKFLNTELFRISEGRTSHSCNEDHKNHKRLKAMKKLQNELAIAVKCVNKRFGNSVLLTVTSNFICLIVAVFWVWTKVIYGGAPLLLGENI